MAGQDYDKDLYIVLTGTGTTTVKNFVDNVEDYIFGDRDEREATLLVPYTKDLSGSLGRVLNEWAIGDDEEPNYPIHAYVEGEAGHKSIAKATTTAPCEEHGTVMTSGALEAAMSDLVDLQRNGNEVVVVVSYDEDQDVRLVGELKNYNSIPVLNLNGMIDDFPGFKTTDEILKEEREREEFETKEAIRITAEKEQEKLQKAADKPTTPRKTAAKKAVPAVEDKPLTDKAPAKKAAAPRKRAAAKPPVAEKPAEPDYKVGDVVEVGGIPFVKHSELPKDLEPVQVIKPQMAPADKQPLTDQSSGVHPVHAPDTQSATDTATVDVWADVARAQGSVDTSSVTHYSVQKDNLIALGEGIRAMSEAHAKTIDSLLKIMGGK